MMKKLILLLFMFASVFFFMPQAGHAEGEPVLYLNGRQLAAEVPPRIVGAGTTMVPVRVIAEGLGAKVGYNPADQSVTVDKDDVHIYFKINQKQAVSGKNTVALEEAPILDSGNTLLPIRFIAGQLGLDVSWDQKANAVNLKSKPPEIYFVQADQNKITIKSTDKLQPKSFALTGPDRIVIDFPNAVIGKTLTGTDGSNNGEMKLDDPHIAEIRFAMFSTSPNTARIVVDLKDKIDYNLIESVDTNEVYVQLGNSSTAASAGTKSGTTASATGTVPVAASGNPPEAAPGAAPSASSVSASSAAPGTAASCTPADVSTSASSAGLKNTVAVVQPCGTNTPAASPTPGSTAQPAASVYKIVLDAGHGGKDTGAISASGFNEKDFTLSMVLKINKLLSSEKQLQVILTRSDDTFIELDKRVEIANTANAALFVSIHGNFYTNDTANGTETFYNRDVSIPLAQQLHGKIVPATGFTDRGVRQADYRVIKATTMPAVLCEIGFLSNKDNEAVMYNDSAQDKIAAAIAQGIKEFLHIK